MCGGPKRSPERSRKMADGKPTFLGKWFQFHLAVQVLLEQFHNAPSLPRCQTAFELRNSFRSLTILRDKVRTNCHGERIHEQLREHLWPIQAWQKPAAFTKLIELAQRLLDAPDYIENPA